MNKLEQAIFDTANQEVPEHLSQQAAERVRVNLFAGSRTAPERLRSCADFQAIIPSYLDHSLSAGRSLLLQDHTRECVACRGALEQARAGTRPTLVRPVTPPSHTIPKFWAIAAMAVVTAGLGAWIINQTFRPAGGGQIAVHSVNGILYAVSDRGSMPIFSGKEIAEGQRIRTSKDSTATVRLPDGSLVEMNQRSELSVTRSGANSTVRLDRGSIIVQAAKQRTGTLDVLTADCTISVKGTIFAVDRGTKGSRVSVVEGSVKVAQGAQSQMLKPGDQVSTDASLQKQDVQDAVAWSRESSRYLALLGEFSIIKKGLDKVPAAGLRHNSKLLDYIGDDTVMFASIPNLSTTLAEAERLFRERLQESEVLRTWWEEQKDGPKLDEMLAKLRTFSEYLGEEIVFTIGGDWEGNYTEPLVLAEIKRPGLDVFLNNELRQLALKGDKHLPEVVQLQPRAEGSDNGYYRRNKRSRAARQSGDQMTIGIRDNVIAIGWNADQLDEVAQRLARPEARNRESRLLTNVRKSYESGAGWLMCVNMEHITDNARRGKGSDAKAKLPAGLEAMRFLIVERKDIAGQTANQATLTFEGRRSGIAAWLSEPAPMGSLDFISPNATFVVSMALRNPQWMLGDLFRTLSDQNPKFEEHLEEIRRESGLRLSPSLGEPLGGDITFAVDGPLLPLPSWKLVAEVYSPEKMQWGIDQLVQAFNNTAKCETCKLRVSREQVGSRTFYTITTDQIAYEIHYVYVDGFFVAAPTRSLLTRAIQNRETGYVLARSEAFRSQLPRDGRMNFSAIVYHNLGSALAPLANSVGAVAGANEDTKKSIAALAANSTPGLIYAYGEADRITVASNGTFFGLDLNSFALPSLIQHGIGGKAKTAKASRIQ